MDLSYTATDLSPHRILHHKNPALALEIKLFCVGEAQTRIANRDAFGHLRIATMYMRGIMVELDPKAIVLHLEMAGDRGDVMGYMYAAAVFAEGKYGVKRNVEKAVELYQKAIDLYDYDQAKLKKIIILMPTQGLIFGSLEITNERIAEMAQNFDPDAQYLYSVMLRVGAGGVTASEYNRTKFLGYAAKAGCVPAMYEYSKCHQYGAIIPRDPILAVENLKKAADGGDNYARHDYANSCLLGTNGVRVNFELAVKYLKDAADDSFAPSQFAFSKACTNGHGVTPDPVKAAIYMQYAADNKMQKAQMEFAYMCMNGIGVPQNKFKAARYYVMIAENPQENISLANQAAQMYAKMCLNADGIPQDFSDAAKYFRMVAKRGCIDSAYNYAKLCAEYKVFAKGLEEAADYFKIAADAEHAIAQYMLARMCRYMQLAGLTIEQAVVYYKMCANNQNIRGAIGVSYSNKAAKEYALMLLNGDEITQNLEEARIYLRIAANRGCTESEQKLQELEGEQQIITIPGGRHSM